MNSVTKNLIILIVISLLFFLFSGFGVDSMMEDKAGVASELFSPNDSIYQYNSAEIAPYKYRFLFSTIVQASYEFLKGGEENNDLFYYNYVVISGIFYVSATIAFYYLLLTVGFSPNFSLGGCIIFLFSPAVLLAYTIPVHTREDFMGYLILCLGLISILQNKTFLVLLFSVLGICCRETLLILPFIYLFFQPSAKIIHRVLIATISFVVFFLIRYLKGYEQYDVLELGLFYNLENLLESVGFLFIVFNFMWIFFILDIYKNYIFRERSSNRKLQLFRDSALPVFLLIFLSTFFGGRINEIRLLFLFFPWIIMISLIYINILLPKIKQVRNDKLYVTFTCGLLLVILVAIFATVDKISSLIPKGQYEVPFEQWIIITFLYLFISIIALSLVYKFRGYLMEADKSLLSQKR